MAQVKAGRLKALAVTGPRLPALPDVPGIGETVNGFSFTNWWGILAPAGTPPRRSARLNDELTAIAAMPDVRERLSDLGLAAQSSTPQQFADQIRTRNREGRAHREGRRHQARIAAASAHRASPCEVSMCASPSARSVS